MGQIETALSQRNNRHVVKGLDSNGDYVSSFGVYGEPQYTIDERRDLVATYGLAYPAGIASDWFDQVFVCDSANERIVKLNSDLVYDSEIDVSVIGKPFSAFFDFGLNDQDQFEASLYVAGISKGRFLSIAKIDLGWHVNNSDFNWDVGTPTITKYDTNVGKAFVNYWPFSISKVNGTDDLVISNGFVFLKVTETDTGFNDGVDFEFTGKHEDFRYYGHILHSSGDLILNVRDSRGSRLARVHEEDDGSYTATGSTDRISEFCIFAAEDQESNILVYDCGKAQILKFDEFLNFVEVVFVDTGETIDKDAYDVAGILSFGLVIDEQTATDLVINEGVDINRFIEEI